MAEAKENKWCVVVPGYQEGERIGPVVEGIRGYCRDVVVIDDGSGDATAQNAEAAGATVLMHARNMGKGVALNTGFKYARENGFEFVITMDADGQHAPGDIPAFLGAYEASGFPVLIGNRMDRTETMPLVRRLTNRFMSWVLSREMGQRVPDTQCGYRLYRCDVLPEFPVESGGFAAESEVLLDLADQGVRMGSVPVQVIYGDERSKICPGRDTLRFLGMLRRHKRKRAARRRGE